jgi:hypothetical protein
MYSSVCCSELLPLGRVRCSVCDELASTVQIDFSSLAESPTRCTICTLMENFLISLYPCKERRGEIRTLFIREGIFSMDLLVPFSDVSVEEFTVYTSRFTGIGQWFLS